MQVTSRVSLGIAFEEESTLKTFLHSKSLSFIIYFSAAIYIWFSADILVLERSQISFIYHICLLEFYVYTQKISVTFIGVFAAFPASFCLPFLQDSDIFWRCKLHTTPRRPSKQLFFGLGNISPLFSFPFWVFCNILSLLGPKINLT